LKKKQQFNTTRIHFCESEREIGFARLFEQTNNYVWTPRSTWGWPSKVGGFFIYKG